MQPNVRVVSEDEQSPSHVCLNCRARKRKCSKTKPSCDSCSKLLLKCVYAAPSLESSLGSGIIHRTDSASVQREWEASAEMQAMFARAYEGGNRPTDSILHDSVMNRVLGMLVDSGASLPAVFSEYFRTIGVWFPVLNSRKIQERQLDKDRSSEGALLLLCMFLIIQIPEEGRLYPPYFLAKSLLSAMLGAGCASLEVSQSATLILLYETGHGMLEQARVSIGSYSRHALRLITKQKDLNSSQTDDTEEERLWFSVNMLDRHLNIGLPPDEIQLSGARIDTGNVKLPAITRYDKSWPGTPDSMDTSSPATYRLSSFRRSSDLLGDVLEFTQSTYHRKYIDTHKLKALDGPLQAQLADLMQNSTQSWEDSCESIGTCVIALFTLHKARYDIAQRNSYDLQSHDQKELATMVFKSLINIVVEISCDFNSRLAYIDLPALPSPSIYAVYQAAIMSISFSGNSFGTEQWSTQMKSLRTTLAKFGSRWHVSSRYLSEVDVAIHKEAQTRGLGLDTLGIEAAQK